MILSKAIPKFSSLFSLQMFSKYSNQISAYLMWHWRCLLDVYASQPQTQLPPSSFLSHWWNFNRASQAGVCLCVRQVWPSCCCVFAESSRRSNHVRVLRLFSFLVLLVFFPPFLFPAFWFKREKWGALSRKALYIETQACEKCPTVATNQNMLHNIYFPTDDGGLKCFKSWVPK